MRIISWNMHRKNGNWDFLLNDLDPDIALLQETSNTKDLGLDSFVSATTVKKNLRSSVYVKNGYFETVKLFKFSGMGLHCVKTVLPKMGELYSMSIYGNLAYSPGLNFHLSGLISSCVQKIRSDDGARHIVIAGDFNMDRRMDDNPTGTRFAKYHERRQNVFFDSILSLGFQDCIGKFHPDFIQTYRHTRGNYPWQLDHMFATPEVSSKLGSLEVRSDDHAKALSDHSPVIAEFDLS